MKKILFVTGLLAILAGCTKETLSPDAATARGTVLKASLENLKTSIDGVKVSWTAGDAICVNGMTSKPITSAAATGVFGFDSELQAPYKAVYPSYLYKNATKISLPSIWTSFNVPLMGYLASGDEISFKSFTSIIKLTVTAEDPTTLSSVKLTVPAGTQVCGDFTVDYETGALTPAGVSPADTTVKVMVNKPLSATPVTVYLPVPPGTYSNGYKIEFADVQGRTMTCQVSARTLVAGELRTMDPVAFVPGGSPVSLGGIRDAQDFLEFAAAVNSGASTARWENASGWVTLLDDIDFSGISSWTPVGNAAAPWDNLNPALPMGQPAFTGKFDGNNHHIKNLHLTDAGTVAGQHYGIFGYVKGGTVQNFVIDGTCSLTVTSSASHSVGMVAGVVYDGEIRDVTSYAPMTYQGGATGYFHMAMIGGIYADQTGTVVDSVNNRGEINAVNTANLNAGATGLHVAGIVGFANAGDSSSNRIAECSNFGAMTSQAGRTAGILGAANKNTTVENCINWGNQVNDMPKTEGARLGNICCFTNNNSVITGCTNHGNLISKTSGRVGGIVSLVSQNGGGTYANNKNYGEIISDSQYRGVFFGYLTATSTWSGTAGGKVGTYNNNSFVYDSYTEADKAKYLGLVGGSVTLTSTDVVYEIGMDSGLDTDAAFRILFIGNSFTLDAVSHLPGIVKGAGLNGIQMILMYYGGRTIPEYNDGWITSSDYTCYYCNPGRESWSTLSGKSLAEVATIGKYDIVTLQEHTGRQLAWGWTSDEKTAVQELMSKVKAAQTTQGGNPKLYYILSQAYHDISKSQSVTRPFSTTEQMWEVIAAHGQTCVTECGFDGVISTGAMLQNLRTSNLNNERGLTRDGYHMDYGLARYGASCAIYEKLFGQLDLSKNKYRYNGESHEPEECTPVTDDNAPVALAAARYALAKPYEVTDMSSEPIVINISNATELQAFASRVNSGDAEARTAIVNLTADIDCSGISNWTPIGAGGMSTWTHLNLVTTGNPFTGTFNGNNHTISNLVMNFTSSDSYGAYGFFGILGDGATVKDLTFANTCSMVVTANYGSSFGVLAGLAKGVTISNVISRAAITGGGTASLGNNTAAGRTMVGGLIGEVHPSATVATLTGLHNYGNIGAPDAVFTKGANAGNGANGFEVGCIAGFSTNTNNTTLVTFKDCVNDGNIWTDAGRSSGMVAACNRYTKLDGCINNGNMVSTVDGYFRLGNITCIAGIGCILDGCINNGNLTALACECVAGVVNLANDASLQIKNCASLGATILGKNVVLDGAQTNNGVLVGYCNAAVTFSACRVSGVFGTDADHTVTLTADNYFPYSGHVTSKCTTFTETTITFAQ